MLLEYVPSLHGSAALAPTRQYEPGSQATQVFSPSPAWYLPAVHLLHVPLPASGWTVPGLHSVCFVLPTGEKWPASDGLQSAAAPRSVLLECVPSPHGRGADAPSGQYEPGTHTWHSIRPDSFMNLPALHLSHADCFLSGCTVPALHGACSVLPVGAKWPASVSAHSLGPVRLVKPEYVPSAHGSGAKVGHVGV